ncbi:hypothetical protein N0V90_012060 [Kalmusia sp. IMI 367209]|nr:hypothetical protein N0V90_012060 [Kalmusia sp. IMI 367209]
MEKRRGRGGRARTTRTKKTKQRKQKTKKQQKSRKQKTRKQKTKGKNTKGKKSKQCRRTNSGNCGKTLNYMKAEEAAKKKGQTLQLNQAYMLKYESGTDMMAHAKLIVGTVRKNNLGELDFDAFASSLTFEGDVADIEGCNRYFGAKCKHGPTREYKCSQGPGEGNYKFKGSASPVFADRETFLQAGEMILERNTKYNILYNNCQTHVKKLRNVAKLKKGEDPTVPEQPTTPNSESSSGGGSGHASHDGGSDRPEPGLRITNPDTDSDGE